MLQCPDALAGFGSAYVKTSSQAVQAGCVAARIRTITQRDLFFLGAALRVLFRFEIASTNAHVRFFR